MRESLRGEQPLLSLSEGGRDLGARNGEWYFRTKAGFQNGRYDSLALSGHSPSRSPVEWWRGCGCWCWWCVEKKQAATDKIVLGMSIGQLALLLKQTNDLAGSADHYHKCLTIFEETDGPKRCVRGSKKQKTM